MIYGIAFYVDEYENVICLSKYFPFCEYVHFITSHSDTFVM